MFIFIVFATGFFFLLQPFRLVGTFYVTALHCAFILSRCIQFVPIETIHIQTHSVHYCYINVEKQKKQIRAEEFKHENNCCSHTVDTDAYVCLMKKQMNDVAVAVAVAVNAAAVVLYNF